MEAITCSASGMLTIDGDDADKVELAAGQWSTGAPASGYATYTSMASGVTLLIHTGIEVSYIA